MRSLANIALRILVLLKDLWLSGAYAQLNVDFAEHTTEVALNRIRDDLPRLTISLKSMPKGGDLHNHLFGAIYAERFLDWAMRDTLCVSRLSFVISAHPCNKSNDTILATELPRLNLYEAAIDAYSMRDFVPVRGSGHDHFFATFEKFDLAGQGRSGELLAEAIKTAAGDKVSYLELMSGTPRMDKARELGARLGWQPNFEDMRSSLLGGALTEIVLGMPAYFDTAEACARALLHCEETPALPECSIVVRY